MNDNTIKLTMKNVGPIKSADIEIDGITVIAGTNGSGKTSIGKVLYVWGKTHSIAGEETSIKYLVESIYELLEYNILRRFRMHFDMNRDVLNEELKKIVLNNDNSDNEKIELIKNYINEFTEGFIERLDVEPQARNLPYGQKRENTLDKKDVYEEIKNILELKNDFSKLIEKVENIYLRKEFNGHFKNVYAKGEPFYEIMYTNLLNDVTMTSISTENYMERFYLRSNNIALSHKEDFSYKLKSDYHENPVDDMVKKDSLDEVISMITDMLSGGAFYFDKKERVFIYEKDGHKFKPINTANGIQTLGYFTRLLNLDFVSKDNLLILDEPETSLHPKWQTKFANALITLNKEFGLKIVVLSHSPYFINAIEDLAEINAIKPNFYLLNETDVDSGEFVSKKVESMGDIYDCLDEGFTDVDNILIEKRRANKKD